TEGRHAEWYPEFRQSPPGSPDELVKIPLRRLVRSEDIADACVFLASDASSYVTGDSIRVMGGRVMGGRRGTGRPGPGRGRPRAGAEGRPRGGGGGRVRRGAATAGPGPARG